MYLRYFSTLGAQYYFASFNRGRNQDPQMLRHLTEKWLGQDWNQVSLDPNPVPSIGVTALCQSTGGPKISLKIQ